jgi:hypothetical protein
MSELLNKKAKRMFSNWCVNPKNNATKDYRFEIEKDTLVLYKVPFTSYPKEMQFGIIMLWFEEMGVSFYKTGTEWFYEADEQYGDDMNNYILSVKYNHLDDAILNANNLFNKKFDLGQFETVEVRVVLFNETIKSYGCLVDVFLNEQNQITSASRLVWFPKKISELETRYFNGKEEKVIRTAKWIAETNNCKAML